jgi:murein DD-endopeptidase MepM/ murein hydrolase activator NlpD
MRKRALRATFVVCLSVLGVLVANPATADSPPLSKDAQSAASIDELKASDNDLVKAIAALDNEVTTQQASLTAAQQAVDAANQAFAANTQAIGQTQARIDQLVHDMQQPVDNDHPAGTAEDLATQVLTSGDFATNVNTTRQHNVDTLNELRAAKTDLDRERDDATNARKIAGERRKSEQSKLDALNVARSDKARLETSLQDRINAAAAEDEASAQSRGDAGSGRASRGGDTPAPDTTRISAAGLQWPTPSHTVASPYGMRWGRMHEGVDIEAPIGTPIEAAKAGTVSYAGWESGYGNYTCIAHGGGFQTCYGHQSKINVKVGQLVDQGQEIGLSGNTGASEGAHLHFETCQSTGPECFYGKYANPMNYLP